MRNILLAACAALALASTSEAGIFGRNSGGGNSSTNSCGCQTNGTPTTYYGGNTFYGNGTFNGWSNNTGNTGFYGNGFTNGTTGNFYGSGTIDSNGFTGTPVNAIPATGGYYMVINGMLYYFQSPSGTMPTTPTTTSTPSSPTGTLPMPNRDTPAGTTPTTPTTGTVPAPTWSGNTAAYGGCANCTVPQVVVHNTGGCGCACAPVAVTACCQQVAVSRHHRHRGGCGCH